jgi:hypothetical protein
MNKKTSKKISKKLIKKTTKKQSKKQSKKLSKKLSKKISGGESKKLCCQTNATDKSCVRKSDQKEFDIANRRFSKKDCLTKPIKGFTMRSSCAPYKDCAK